MLLKIDSAAIYRFFRVGASEIERRVRELTESAKLDRYTCHIHILVLLLLFCLLEYSSVTLTLIFLESFLVSQLSGIV